MEEEDGGEEKEQTIVGNNPWRIGLVGGIWDYALSQRTVGQINQKPRRK